MVVLVAGIVVFVCPLLTFILWARRGKVDELQKEIGLLRYRLTQLEKAAPREAAPASVPQAPTPEAPVVPPPPLPAPEAAPPSVVPQNPVPGPPAPAPDPRPPVPVLDHAEVLARIREGAVPEPQTAPVPRAKSINWENFLGVKLFAWVGGVIAFLAAAFFLKYSFEHNLVPPALRVAIGLAVGIGALGFGLRLDRARYAVLIQSLTATGILILYGSLFGAHALYQLIPNLPTFGLMALVTAVAFLLAVRLDAPAVAVIGLLGGFLTPLLLSTGQDNPVGLFSYLALLDAGLAAVVARKRWTWLLLLAALGTAGLQAGWTEKFFTAEKAFTAYVVYDGFAALFAAAFVFLCRKGGGDPWASAAVLIPPAAAFLFATYLVSEPVAEVARRVGPFFGFLFLADAAVLVAVCVHAPLRAAFPVAGALLFLLVGGWIETFVSEGNLLPILAVVLLFAVLHGLVPAFLQRLKPEGRAPAFLNLFPPVALLLVMLPLLNLPGASFAIWGAVLLLDLFTLVLAVLTGTLAGVVGALVLTVVVLGTALFRIPAGVTGLPPELLLVGVFAGLFFAAGIWAAKRPAATGSRPGIQVPDSVLPASSALLPFLLLIVVADRLPMPDPSPLFGIATFILLLSFAAAARFNLDAVGAGALGALAALELSWHHARFDPALATRPLLWYPGLLVLTLGFVFAFRARLEARATLYGAAALFGGAQFFFTFAAVRAAHPNEFMGLLPAAFALPYLAGTALMARSPSPARLAILSWLGGAALFFISAIFPVQFDRQWITVAWAIEGAALLWLWKRLPHEGLRIAGALLLTAATARLLPALNPFLLAYHVREGRPILNWILYTYGLTAAALFAGARLVDPARPRILKLPARPILEGMGTLVLFLLLNLEIADYFSGTESHITFRFSGNLAQDMTYSIAWALFAFGLLVAGIKRSSGPARWAGLGLLVITLCKAFLHDLWRLGGLYRIGSLLGLAVVLFAVSFVYQRFLVVPKKEPAP